ncbi:MAG: sugar phosphate isomerase/epimerase family protein [Chitinophagaceae bacterium]
MRLLFFCPRWGQANTNWNIFLNRVKLSGYDGIEGSSSQNEKDKDEMLNGLAKHDLKFIGQHWETVEPDFEKHYKEFEFRLRDLADAKPIFINSQTGKDYYSCDQNKKLISLAKDVAKEIGIAVIHETHRGKFSFAAHITKQYLENFPDLRITLDISHWCNTAESLLQDQKEAVDLAISRTDHIHARVGFAEGPQITDPSDPAWNEEMQFHLNCWDKVVELKKDDQSELTITPEFGPHPYMMNLPFTQQPVTDQWDVNEYMMSLLKERYRS